MITLLRWFFRLIDRRPSPTRHLPPLNVKNLGGHFAAARDKTVGFLPHRFDRW